MGIYNEAHVLKQVNHASLISLIGSDELTLTICKGATKCRAQADCIPLHPFYQIKGGERESNASLVKSLLHFRK
jgi:hypothetical protein